jgi:hypothetical protein
MNPLLTAVKFLVPGKCYLFQDVFCFRFLSVHFEVEPNTFQGRDT